MNSTVLYGSRHGSTRRDPARTLLTTCALPQEMPVVEAVELRDRAAAESHVTVGACFLNGTFPVPVTEREAGLLDALAVGHAAAAETRLGAGLAPGREGPGPGVVAGPQGPPQQSDERHFLRTARCADREVSHERGCRT